MPHAISITGVKYAGDYTFYTKSEADAAGLRYHIPPFGAGDIPKSGWVLTTNNFVIPILDAVSHARGMMYVTPFGRHRRQDMPFMDGRRFSRGVESTEQSTHGFDLRNLAWWMARYGDSIMAYRMAFGSPAPADLDDTIRSFQFQTLLHAEMERFMDELQIPKADFINERLKQTRAMTEMIEAAKESIVKKLAAGIELNETETKLFFDCFSAQQGNLTDVEKGYIRTPVDAVGSPAMLEAHYTETRRVTAGANGFHMTKTIKPTDSMPENEGGKLTHPDGFYDIDYDAKED